MLADCIMSNKPVKRIMYKDGKRYLETEWNSNDASDNVGLVHENVNEYTACIDNNVNENIAVDQPQNNTTSLPATMRIEPELSSRDTNSSHSDIHLVSEIESLRSAISDIRLKLCNTSQNRVQHCHLYVTSTSLSAIPLLIQQQNRHLSLCWAVL